MPCFHPRQVSYILLPSGKKELNWSPTRFSRSDGLLDLPCGKCIACKLKKSREWGLRCVHESRLYEQNSFLTLTFSSEGMQYMCPTASICKKHVSAFVKNLRNKLRFVSPGLSVNYYGCGEYGGLFGRPHYHLCLFGYDFPDKKKFSRTDGGYWIYTSDFLQELWPYGHSSIGDLTFKTAAYTARYCLKKITGSSAADHYKGRVPEFSSCSNRPGIGYEWFHKYAETDLINQGSCILDGYEVGIPRYYLRLWEKFYPGSFDASKYLRKEAALRIAIADQNGPCLESQYACLKAKLDKLIRVLEVA